MKRSSGGVAIAVVLIVALLALVGGAGYLFLQKQQEAAQAEETRAMAAAIGQAVYALDDRATADDVRRVRQQINTYREREGINPSVLQPWDEKLAEVESTIEARRTELTALLERARGFSMDSSRTDVDAFDDEVAAFARSLTPISRNELLNAWNQRKREILAAIESVSATLRLRTFPGGARAYLDGRLLGTTPLGVGRVRRGTHEVRFEKEGHRPVEITIDVTESTTIEPATVELPFETGGLQVVVTGAGAGPDLPVEVGLEKADDSDFILYSERQPGRDVHFAGVPVGAIQVFVYQDQRIVGQDTATIEQGRKSRIVISLD